MRKLPRDGIPWIEVLREINKLLSTVPHHLLHYILGSMTTHPHPLAQVVFYLTQIFNLNDIAMYEKLREIELEAVEMLGEILGCESCTGMVTTGGTEANLAALYLAREHGYDVVYLTRAAHDSLFKGLKLFKMRGVIVAHDKNFEMDVADLEEKCSKYGPGLIVATIGTTGTGGIDPIEEIARVAKRYGCLVHIDAAFGGFIAPFIYRDRMLGFQHPPIISATMDPHKLGLVPIPAGGFIVRDEVWLQPLIFEARYMPAGKQIGLLGTRTAASAIATWAMLKHYGWKGYEEQARELMHRASMFIDKLKTIGLNVVGVPRVPIVCIDLDEDALHYLWNKGFYVYRCGVARGIRVVVMPHVTSDYLEELARELANFVYTHRSKSF